MNARSIQKMLMRGRVRTFYGARAVLVVRVPLATLPPVPPRIEPLGKPAAIAGQWTSNNSDGTTTLSHISEWHGSKRPGPDRMRRHGFSPTIHRATLDSSYDDGDERYERWSWYTAVRQVFAAGVERSPAVAPLEQSDLPLDVVERYIARREWRKRYGCGHRALDEKGTGFVWLDELHAAEHHAAAFDSVMVGDDVAMDLVYAVKWRRHPSRKRRFCAQIKRAMATARRAGVRLRVMAPPKEVQ